MKKHLSLILLPLISSTAIPTVTTFSSCTKKSNISITVDSHVKSYSYGKPSSFYVECEFDLGYQFASVEITINDNVTPQKYITITKNRVYLSDSIIWNELQKVTVDIKTTRTTYLPVTIKNNKFDVESTSFSLASDSDLIINPTSRQYKNQDVHLIKTLCGEFQLCNDDTVYKVVQFKGYDAAKQFKMSFSDYAKEYGAGLFNNIIVDLKFAEIALSNPWNLFAELSADSSGLETAKEIFNIGDYASLYFEETKCYQYARIADMGVDTIAGTSNKANFTFEFMNPVCDPKQTLASGVRVSAWSSAINNNYSESTIINTINNVATGGFKQMLKAALGDAASSIKTITRNYLRTNETLFSTNYYNTTFDTEIFLPGLKNVMSDAGIDEWSVIPDEDKPVFKLEQNPQYQFYKNEIADKDYQTSIKNNIFVRKYKTTKETEYCSVWLGTPDVRNIYKAMLFKSTESSDTCKYNMISFAPCFCF